MTAEELNQIYYLNKEIKMWKRELIRSQSRSLIGGKGMDGMPRGGGLPDPVADRAIEEERIRQLIDGKLAEIQIQRGRIIEYIATVQDSFMRQIIYYRHIGLMSWRQVALHIGGGNTEEGVKKAHQRFIKKSCPECPDLSDRMVEAK